MPYNKKIAKQDSDVCMYLVFLWHLAGDEHTKDVDIK